MLDSLLSAIESVEEKTLIEKLFHEYETQMYSTAFSILHSRNDAEDAVQSAFLKIIDYLPELNLGLNPQTQSLLTITTRNIALNEVKKRNRRLKNEIDFEDVGTIPDIRDFDKIGYKEIGDLVAKLPEDLKNVIILRFILDYSPQMTANLLDITESAVYKRIAAARKLLKSFVEECYG